MEDILVLLKPDAVARGICGAILSRFEQRGLHIVAMKMMHLSREMAEQHYSDHRNKRFYDELVDYIVSGPLVAMIVRGPNAVKLVRAMMGYTNPLEAVPGTIRADFAMSVENNVIHGSDCAESAAREIRLFFDDREIYYRD